MSAADNERPRSQVFPFEEQILPYSFNKQSFSSEKQQLGVFFYLTESGFYRPSINSPKIIEIQKNKTVKE